MLPICFLLDWFNTSHAPDETTILNFRHLHETHALCGQFTVWCN
jgi:IS5 family transposase